jgi:hypothetical protein
MMAILCKICETMFIGSRGSDYRLVMVKSEAEAEKCVETNEYELT